MDDGGVLAASGGLQSSTQSNVQRKDVSKCFLIYVLMVRLCMYLLSRCGVSGGKLSHLGDASPCLSGRGNKRLLLTQVVLGMS